MAQKKILFIFLFFLSFLFPLTAQEKENRPLQKMKNAFRSENFNLSGYGQIVYNYTERSHANTSNNSLDVARAILVATGKLGEKNQFGYTLMFDFGSNAKLHEFYGEWLPLKAVNLRVGQYKIPFSIENPISSALIETINFSRSASAMNGNAGDVNQFDRNGMTTGVKAGRDLGLQLSGQLFFKNKFHHLEYYAGLFNGAGFNTKDVDNHKDFIGTAYLCPIKDLCFGGSVYLGKMYENRRNRWAVGGEYSGKHFYSRAEYIVGYDGDIKRNGYYGSLVYKIVPNKWEVLCKYDVYNSNTALNNNGINDITAGVNYYFAFLSRIQVNYVYTIDALQGNNNTLLAQLQVFF